MFLYWKKFSGSIPPDIGQLTNLTLLALNNNNLCEPTDTSIWLNTLPCLDQNGWNPQNQQCP